MIHFGCRRARISTLRGPNANTALGLLSIDNLLKRNSSLHCATKTSSKPSAAFRYGTANSQFEPKLESKPPAAPPKTNGSPFRALSSAAATVPASALGPGLHFCTHIPPPGKEPETRFPLPVVALTAQIARHRRGPRTSAPLSCPSARSKPASIFP